MRGLTFPLLPVSAVQERENSRFRFRRDLFQRRGVSLDKASEIAARLTNRDAERDDRRICLECESSQRGGKCFQAMQGLIPGICAPKNYEPVHDILHRCDFFSYQIP